MKRKNTNCLTGMRCPTCGSLEPFTIYATCTVEVWDEGTDVGHDYEWDAMNYCRCHDCGLERTVDVFTVGTQAYKAAHGGRKQRKKKRK